MFTYNFSIFCNELPVIRDPYSNCYLRQEAKGLIVGIYEKNAKAWALDGMDWRFDMELLEPEFERIEDNLVKGMNRIQLFHELGIKRTIINPDMPAPINVPILKSLMTFFLICSLKIYVLVLVLKS